MFDLFQIPEKWMEKAPFVAVSGGQDSMVLLHFLCAKGLKPKVLHCNFNLRGHDSDEDQRLVESFCAQNELELRVKEFNTLGQKKAQESFQMLCRRLRYQWFEEVLNQNSDLLMAHHKGDQLETLLMSVYKRKSLFELSGIPVRNGSYYRPLLGTKKEEIQKYAEKNTVPFRVDKSNLESKYLRNFFRNEVLGELSDSFLEKLWNIHEAVLRLKTSWKADFHKWDKCEFISLAEPCAPKLSQYLISRGFTVDSAEKICNSRKKNGLSFSTVDKRNFVIFDLALHPKEISESNEVIIDSIETEFTFGEKKYSISKGESGSENKILIDASYLKWPLRARTAVANDKMRLLGMKGSKKITDIFKEQKIPPAERDKYFVLEDANRNIIALEFLRRSDFALLSNNTLNLIEIS